MSRSKLHDWECAIKRLSGDNADKMLAIAQDIYNTAFVRGKNYMSLEQQPCDDCISRQAVTDMLTQEWTKYIPMELDINLSFVLEKINELPSVTSQPKVGEWLEKEVSDKVIEEWQSARCSVCDRYHTTPYMYYFSHYDYCPHCGTKMEGRQRLDERRSKRNR